MNKYKVYQPQYYKKFQCTGSECRDNCCHHWTITIDKGTYDKYMELGGDAKKEFNEKISVLSEEPFKAVIVLDEDKNCQFLNERGLCAIHARYGHEYLSHTCRTYPRKYYQVFNEIEAFLEFSCEVVARNVLFDQNIMKFEDSFLEGGEQIRFNNILRAEKYVPAGDAEEVFWKLRTASIVIVQSRQYRLQTRMLVLGMFIKQANELLSSGREGEIAALAETFLDRVESGAYKDLADVDAGGADLDVGFISGILNDMEGKHHELFRRCVGRAREALGVFAGDEKPPDGFGERYKRYYEMYFADKEYVLENYVVGHIFADGFPFNYKLEDSIMKNYRELLVKFNLLKFILVGVSRYCNKYDKRRVVECVSSFSKAYDHHLGGALIMK